MLRHILLGIGYIVSQDSYNQMEMECKVCCSNEAFHGLGSVPH